MQPCASAGPEAAAGPERERGYHEFSIEPAYETTGAASAIGSAFPTQGAAMRPSSSRHSRSSGEEPGRVILLRMHGFWGPK